MNGILHSRTLDHKLERAGPALWQIAAAASGFALAGGSVFGGLYPLGLGLVIGAASPWVLSCGAGAALGYLLLLPTTDGLRYIAAVMAALAGRGLFRRSVYPGAAGGCTVLLAVQLMLSLSGLSSVAQAVAALGEALLSAGFGVLLDRTRTHRSLWLGPVPTEGVVLGLALLPSLCAIPAGPVLPAVTALGAVGLALAYRGRLRECAALSVAGGTLIAAARPDLAFAGLSVAAACLAAGWAAPGERTGSGAVFLSAAVFGSLAAPDSLAALGFLGSAVLAEIAFFIMPRRWLAAIPGQAQGTAVEAGQRSQLSGAAARLEQAAEVLSDIAETVNQVYTALPKKGENYNWVVDHVAEELCRSCGRRETCWMENYSDTVDGFYRLKPILEQQGHAAVEQLPGQFCRCIHPVELCGSASRAYTLYRSRRESRVKAGAMRSAVTEQYTALAGALANMAQQMGQSLAPDEGKSARIGALFSSIGLEPLEMEAGYESTGRLKVSVTVSRTSFSEEELSELREEIQRICRRSMGDFDVRHCGAVSIVTISEKAVFCPSFGIASHAAKEVCGDVCDRFCDVFGNAHLLLCDGMGVGKSAAIDGNLAAKLAAQLLKAGFSAQSAARLVNVALALKSDEESSATLDLVTTDLFTGRTRLFKAGGCPTFLLRQGKAEMLDGSSLPVGILQSVMGRQDTVTLTEGCMAVLVSDGALCDGGRWICQQLELCASVGSTPQEVADILADTALERAKSRGRPDDITVAVMRLDRAS